MPDRMRWTIELFGGLRATRGDWVVSRFRTQKIAALLAYLAYHRERSHPREVLIELLWPERKPEDGRNNLRYALSCLRRELEPRGLPRASVIAADRAAVELRPEACTTDVADFRAALESAAASATDGERARWLRRGVALYRGELLPGVYQDWALAERDRLRARYLEATHELVALLRREGRDLAEALDHARRAIAADPLHEGSHRDLMSLTAMAGEPAAALRHYRELERTLERELGTAPALATRHLAREIERGSLPAAPAPRLSDIATLLACEPEAGAGDARASVLRAARAHGGDDARAGEGPCVAVFGRSRDALACAAALASEPAPRGARLALEVGEVELAGGACRGAILDHARSLALAAHQGQILCSEATAALLKRGLEPGFTLADLGLYRLRGATAPERLFELRPPGAARRELPPPRAGPGREGSVPLELTPFRGREEELAHLSSMFASQARLVSITGAGGTGKTRLAIRAASRAREALGGAAWFVSLAGLADPALIPEAICDAMRLARPPAAEPIGEIARALAGDPALLVLDNFEHLLAGAALVRGLLERAPGLGCLVTSRERLGIAGERELPLLPLPVPEGSEPPEALARLPSVQLFVDRARAVRPDFRVTAANAGAVAGLCRKLDGLPLALELAAGWANVLTPEQILGRTEERFALLVSRERDPEDRHRSLSAAIEWSYRLLAPRLQRAFLALSVFPGGIALDAAEAVCPKEEGARTIEDLGRLCECSLLIADGDGGERRFRMLETLREFARERLAPAELLGLQRRHAAHFLAAAERADAAIAGPEAGLHLDRLAAERENFRAALDWAAGSPDGAEIGLGIATSLFRLWYTRGPLAEGSQRLAAALARAPARTAARAAALHAAAGLARGEGDFRAARALVEEALAIYREVGDRRGVSRCLHGLGIVACQVDFRAALPHFEESLALARELGAPHAVASALVGVGQVLWAVGRPRAARPLFEEALEIVRGAGDRGSAAEALNLLGRLAGESGDHAAARPLLDEAQALKEALGADLALASVLMNRGSFHFDQGELVAARTCYERMLALARKAGARQVVANALCHLGRLADSEGSSGAARALFEESLEIDRETNDRSGIAFTLRMAGDLARREGRGEQARALYEESLARLRKLGIPLGVPPCLEGLAALAAEGRDPRRAAALLGAATAVRASIDLPVTPRERPEQEKLVTALRAALGGAFAAAFAAGRGPRWESAVALALRERRPPRRRPVGASAPAAEARKRRPSRGR